MTTLATQAENPLIALVVREIQVRSKTLPNLARSCLTKKGLLAKLLHRAMRAEAVQNMLWTAVGAESFLGCVRQVS